MEERKVDEEVGDTIVVKKKKGIIDDVVRESETDTDSLQENDVEVEEEEEVSFTLPETDKDDEVLADMTPEEAKEFIRKREEEEQKRKEEVASLISEGDRLLSEGNKPAAEEQYYKAVQTDSESTEANYKYAALVTSDFSDFSDFDAWEEAYNTAYENAGENFRLQVKENAFVPVSEKLKALTYETEEAGKAVEEKRSVRREKFSADYKKNRKSFLIVFPPLVLFAVLSLIFGLKINDVQGSTYLVLTLVFAVLTVLDLIVFLVVARKLSTSVNRVKENERDVSTKDGRAYLELKRKVELLSDILK